MLRAGALMGGVVLGLVSSVLPFELGVPLAFAAGLGVLIWSALRPGAFDARRVIVMGAGTWLATVFVCVELPLGYIDSTRVSLSADCVPLSELASAVHAGGRVNDQTLVCFSERAPSLRTVQEAIAQQTDATLRIGSCGTGATFLFGASPMRISIERR